MHKRGFICILLLSLLLGGCGSASNANYSGAKEDVSKKTVLLNENSTTEAEIKAPTEQEKAALSEKDIQTAKSSTNVVPVKQQTGFNSATTAEGLNKKLIYTANLVMRVKDYSVAQSEVRDMVSVAGGYIVAFSEDQSNHEVGGTFVLKVPANGFSSLLNKIEKLKHESFQQNIKGQDVSEEYVDLESRLKVKELMEAQYTEFLKKATKTTDLVSFANELGKIQEDIELIKGRMRYINNNVSYSTVELRLYQQEGMVDTALVNEEKAPLFERANDALKGTVNALTILFQWLVVILFGASPILVFVIIVWIVMWLIRRNRVEKKTANYRNNHHQPVIGVADNQEIKVNDIQDSKDEAE